MCNWLKQNGLGHLISRTDFTYMTYKLEIKSKITKKKKKNSVTPSSSKFDTGTLECRLSLLPNQLGSFPITECNHMSVSFHMTSVSLRGSLGLRIDLQHSGFASNQAKKKKKNLWLFPHSTFGQISERSPKRTSASPWVCPLVLAFRQQKKKGVRCSYKLRCHRAVHHPNVTHTHTRDENLIIATTDQYPAPDIDLHISETSV